MSLYSASVDLTKAFDTVSRNGLWKILARLGCPPKCLTIVPQLYEGQQGQVKHSRSLSGSFSVSNGVKQGCMLASTFSSSFSSSCSVRQKRTCKTASTFVSEQTAVSSTFGCRRSHPLLRCRDLGSLLESDQVIKRFLQCCLRSIFGVKWRDYVSNQEIFKRGSLPNIESIPGAAALCWPRHKERRRTRA